MVGDALIWIALHCQHTNPSRGFVAVNLALRDALARGNGPRIMCGATSSSPSSMSVSLCQNEIGPKKFHASQLGAWDKANVRAMRSTGQLKLQRPTPGRLAGQWGKELLR